MINRRRFWTEERRIAGLESLAAMVIALGILAIVRLVVILVTNNY